MGYFLEKHQKARVRLALSQLFVDTEVDFRAIARELKDDEYDALENILFNEVAPVCYPNLRTPAPPVWAAFDAEWLEKTIEQRLNNREDSGYAALKDRVLSAYLRLAYSNEWKKLKYELDHVRKA